MPAMGQIGYDKPDKVKEYKKLVKKYDAVIFILPCPHDNRQQQGNRSWQELYDIDKPIFVIFHDNLWDRYYEWMKEVHDKVTASLYTIKNARFDSLSRFPCDHYFLPVPLPIEEAGLYDKEKRGRVGWFPQWKANKGVKGFLAACHLIPPPTRVKLYNIGIVYYSIRHEPIWQENVSFDYTTYKKAGGPKNVKFYGLLIPGQIERAYKRCNMAVDLSGAEGPFAGQITCTMLESMLYGSLLLTSDTMMHHRASIIASDATGKQLAVSANPRDPQAIADAVNEAMANYGDYSGVRRDALDYVVANNADIEVARRVVKMIEKYIGKTGQHEKAKFKKLPV